ncbi:MAG TPA: bifunctional [glutamine synthetase] adenylyltransferase/[glutamine synthetase]-adenylyl-L-tyrosine phosphorylase [Actinomycetota bacterium]|nr:bifunctional [glutamine synthetase] adenylyltransferase/[glutamine synthetase]-adenylyl-L-tyrosine phosphorylase [Actinomycetota bacterium]
MSRPETTLHTDLVRIGFTDVERAAEQLQGLIDSESAHALQPADFGLAADPDRALEVITDLARDNPADLRRVLSVPQYKTRLLCLLGLSESLGDFLRRHPDLLDSVSSDHTEGARQRILASVSGPDPMLGLRVAYRRELVGVAARDLAGEAGLETTMAELSALADAALQGCLELAVREVGSAAAQVHLAVVAMGKCGAQELNYISDVDVVFVAEPSSADVPTDVAMRAGQQVASRLMQIANTATSEGSIWEVDAALRPEGKAGALVRTVDSYLAYYAKWAKTWEFQALLKARPAAGDLALGQRYVQAVADLVWSAADRDNFVDDVQAMRRRVEEHIPEKQAHREIKLGRGGLRDVEFAVQLLQLVHGRSDATLRSPSTLPALESLAAWGYVGREDAAGMAGAYRFLRVLEHRVQLRHMRRTHLFPDREPELRVIARSIGMRSDPAAEIETAYAREVLQVRRLHEKLFYRPLLNAVARLDSGEARLTPEAAGQRLWALGYLDPDGALRHLEWLTNGVSRRAAIQRTLLPVLLGWFADCPDPDAGLLGFRQVSDALGASPWYLRLLRDESQTAQSMAHILASSRYATDLLLRAPDAVQILAHDDELVPRPAADIAAEAVAAGLRQADPEAAIVAIRATRRRELFRISAADCLGRLSIAQVGPALSAIADATIQAALAVATSSVIVAGRQAEDLIEFVVLGMGRYGGEELGYSSDADVMFVYRARDGVTDALASDSAMGVANEVRRLLALPSADPPIDLDADLRPEGRNGPLVRSLASYAAYYQRWSAAWEAQALLRARPVAGSPALQDAFVALVDPIRYPASGVSPGDLVEMRRLKARMEAERLPRGADRTLHVKLGRGGLSDVEWVAQLFQLQHGHRLPQLRTTQTVPVLERAAEEGLIADQDCGLLVDAWRLASAIRNAVILSSGRAGDTVPTDYRSLGKVAHLLDYPPENRGAMPEDYRRVTRRARNVMERLFYGNP